MINTTIQLKLTTGEELVAFAVRLNQDKIVLRDVVFVDRMVIHNEDNYGNVTGTQIFYTMKPWFLYNFDWAEPQEIVLERSCVLAIVKPHEEIINQYEKSKVTLRQASLKDEPVFQTLDSDEFDNFGIFENMVKPQRMN